MQVHSGNIICQVPGTVRSGERNIETINEIVGSHVMIHFKHGDHQDVGIEGEVLLGVDKFQL